jgi:hypothetical protein
MTILARRKEMALDFVQELTASMGVTDMDRSIAWYGEVLGYELLYRVDEIGWCEMKTEMAGVNIGLSQNQEVRPMYGAWRILKPPKRISTCMA